MKSRFDGERLDLPAIDDCSSIIKTNPSDVKQCPKCYQLFTKEHKCDSKEYYWSRWSCTICKISLEKQTKKKRMLNGKIYYTYGSKKHFNIINSVVCYNCAMRITRMLKNDK